MKTTRKKISLLPYGVLVLALVVFGVVGVKAEEPAKDFALRTVSAYLASNPDSNIAQGILAVLNKDEAPQDVGVTQLNNESNESPVHRVAFRTENGLGSVVEFWASGNLPSVASATTTDYLDVSGIAAVAKNQEVFITYGDVCLTGTVSSTINVSMGTSTTKFVVWNTSDGEPQGFMDDVNFATSTTNVRFSNGYRACRNSIKDLGTLGMNEIRLTTSTPYMTVFVQDAYNQGCGGVGCEAVTSTNRGWTGTWLVKGFYRKDL